MAEFNSQFEMGQQVEFVPTFKQQQDMGIAGEELDGTIVAVKFTEAKVWYDVLSPYHGIVFQGIPSNKVTAYVSVYAPLAESN